MANGNSGSKISDYDDGAALVVGATAALNTGGGAALIAMSSTFHVTLGAIFLASGVFLFLYLQTHRVRHHKILEALGYDRERVMKILENAPRDH